jgi:peptide/nickel transport system permease protein
LANNSALQGDVPVVQGVLLVAIAVVVVSGIGISFIIRRSTGTDRSAA